MSTLASIVLPNEFLLTSNKSGLSSAKKARVEFARWFLSLGKTVMLSEVCYENDPYAIDPEELKTKVGIEDFTNGVYMVHANTKAFYAGAGKVSDRLRIRINWNTDTNGVENQTRQVLANMSKKELAAVRVTVWTFSSMHNSLETFSNAGIDSKLLESFVIPFFRPMENVNENTDTHLKQGEGKMVYNMLMQEYEAQKPFGGWKTKSRKAVRRC